MKGQQKTSFATATAKVFQTDDLYAKSISTVTKFTLADGTDVLALLKEMKTKFDKICVENTALTKKVTDLEEKVNSFELE